MRSRSVETKAIAAMQGDEPVGPPPWHRFGIYAVAVLLLATAFVGTVGTVSLYNSELAVARVRLLDAALDHLLRFVVDAETGQRGYLITGRPEYLAPYSNSVSRIDGELDTIDALLENDIEHQRLLALRSVLHKKQAELAAVIVTRNDSGFNAAQTLVNNDLGQQYMQQARSIVGEMMAASDDEIEVRRRHSAHVKDLAILAGCLSGLLTLILTITLLRSMQRSIRVQTLATRAITAQKDLLATTLAAIGDGVVVTDANGIVTMMNPVAQALTGWPEHAAEGRHVETVMPLTNEDTRQAVANPAMTALREKRIVGMVNHTLLGVRDGGDPLHIDNSGAPIIGSDGSLQGAILVFRDVTSRKRFEADLRESGRRKTDFIAVLSHELRNPLAALHNALQVSLRLTDASAPYSPLLSPMTRQVKHIGRLVDDLLDIARLTSGKMDLQLGLVDTRQVIQDAVDLANVVMERRQSRVNLILDDRPGWVMADAARLSQVLANLLSNAAQYAPLGSPVSVTQTHSGESVVICVKDAGIGIASDDLERVFLMFVQLDPGEGNLKEGLGIGLSLARDIALLHGGSLEARSAGPGLGSEFILRMPAALAPALFGPAPAGLRPPDGLAATGGRDSNVNVNVNDRAEIGEAATGAGTQATHTAGANVADADTARAAGAAAADDATTAEPANVAGSVASAEGASRTDTLHRLDERANALTTLLADASAAAAGQTAGTQTQPPDASSARANAARGMRVLVADDNRDAADSLATLLEMSDFHVSVAYDGLDAAQIAERTRPDAILLDIGMPGLNGYQVVTRIRADAWPKRPIVFAVTGWGQDHDRAKALAAGFDAHFTKPVDYAVLEEAILDANERQEALAV